MKSDKLKTSARNNTQQDFEFTYFDDIDDALIEGLSQNQDFFSMLLSNDEMKRQVLADMEYFQMKYIRAFATQKDKG